MEKLIEKILGCYNICGKSIEKMGDTSRGEADIRLQYLVNDTYVIKLNTANVISEEFLSQISQLILRYCELGVWAPKLLQTNEGHFLVDVSDDKDVYHCYVEEYAPYKVAENVTDPEGLQMQMMEHIGKLAAKYSGVELMDVPSMWTIIDLHPLDNEVDEKQENLNTLVTLLRERNYEKEAKLLEVTNSSVREQIKKHYKSLPRCVYQGDLNFLNVLVDEEEHFKGLIDFNMAGTEVNINCFLNETMYQLEEKDFEELSAEDIYKKMNRKQQLLLDMILKHYSLNEKEWFCMPFYKKVIEISLYPNVMLWMHLIRSEKYVEKVLQLIQLICMMDEEH